MEYHLVKLENHLNHQRVNNGNFSEVEINLLTILMIFETSKGYEMI